MNKTARFLFFVSLFLFSGSAFARPGQNNSALKALLSDTGAEERYSAAAFPAPAMARAGAGSVLLADITSRCTYQGEVVSAYPALYKIIPREENARIIKIFSFADAKGGERRVEVYFTGGDWMEYGLTYLVTNAGPDRTLASAYFVGDLSTSDREEGSVAPRIDPFGAQLEDFIAAEFLDAAGNVRAVFSSIAAASISAEQP